MVTVFAITAAMMVIIDEACFQIHQLLLGTKWSKLVDRRRLENLFEEMERGIPSFMNHSPARIQLLVGYLYNLHNSSL